MLPMSRAKAEAFWSSTWSERSARRARGARRRRRGRSDRRHRAGRAGAAREPAAPRRPRQDARASGARGGRVWARRCSRPRSISALRAGKTLLVLDTASADAERLYARQGWQRCGRIPGLRADARRRALRDHDLLQVPARLRFKLDSVSGVMSEEVQSQASSLGQALGAASVMLRVRDLRRSIDWFKGTLGLEPFITGIDGKHPYAAFSFGGTGVALWQLEPGDPDPESNLSSTYIVFSVASAIEEIRQSVMSRGARVGPCGRAPSTSVIPHGPLRGRIDPTPERCRGSAEPRARGRRSSSPPTPPKGDRTFEGQRKSVSRAYERGGAGPQAATLREHEPSGVHSMADRSWSISDRVAEVRPLLAAG